MKESDCKILRRLHGIALERFCRRVLEEINDVTSGRAGDYHARYLKVFALIKRRDREMARTFDDPRRSTAIALLTNLAEADLLTEEEFSQFSPQTRDTVEAILEMRRR